MCSKDCCCSQNQDILCGIKKFWTHNNCNVCLVLFQIIEVIKYDLLNLKVKEEHYFSVHQTILLVQIPVCSNQVDEISNLDVVIATSRNARVVPFTSVRILNPSIYIAISCTIVIAPSSSNRVSAELCQFVCDYINGSINSSISIGRISLRNTTRTTERVNSNPRL